MMSYFTGKTAYLFSQKHIILNAVIAVKVVAGIAHIILIFQKRELESCSVKQTTKKYIINLFVGLLLLN